MNIQRLENAPFDVSYDRRTIQLHWVTAILVALLWSIAQIIDYFPKGAPRIAVRSVHIVLGALLGVILVMRVVWRSRSGRRLSMANDRVWGHLARVVHWALYVGLAAAILLGMTNALVRGDSIFSLFRIPKIYPNFPQLKPSIEKFHQTAANALVILAAVHALAAVAHHYILRDGVLRRMLPRDHAK